MIMCDFCALSPSQRRDHARQVSRASRAGGSVAARCLLSARLRTNGRRPRRIAPDLMDGFWSPNPYFGFLNTFKYEAEKVVARQVHDRRGDADARRLQLAAVFRSRGHPKRDRRSRPRGRGVPWRRRRCDLRPSVSGVRCGRRNSYTFLRTRSFPDLHRIKEIGCRRSYPFYLRGRDGQSYQLFGPGADFQPHTADDVHPPLSERERSRAGLQIQQ